MRKIPKHSLAYVEVTEVCSKISWIQALIVIGIKNLC